ARRPYIGPALEIFKENPEIGQILFNRNYAETLADRDIAGGLPGRSAGHGHRYVIHEHYPPKSDAYREFKERHPGHTSAWWPHFSFRPSMVKTSIFAQIGPFNDSVAHFEHDYAERFNNAGLRAAFFDGVYSLHTGRLTSQRGDPTRANAYDLNGEAQFNGAAVEPIFAAEGLSDHQSTRGQGLARQLGMRVINLDRRADRLDSFRRNVLKVAGSDLASRIERFAAIDGRALSLTAELQHLFRGMTSTFARPLSAQPLAIWPSGAILRQVRIPLF
ncbi:MAG TPA: hypothetical protein VFA91_09760, partial [Candidatus Polarisedimenticolia bacterium]|nr:hypothetical protein [Candidatus Polarisedimenticolia bacterium]